jgi:hypothetical protein
MRELPTGDTLPDGVDGAAIHDNVAGEISAITEKVTPVSADLAIIEDSAAGNVKKRAQLGNFPQATETQRGLAEIATQAEVDAGTDDLRYITPAKLRNTEIDALQIARFDFTLQNNGQRYMEVGIAAYTTVASFIFHGTTLSASPNKCFIIATGDGGTDTGNRLRVQDVTNGLTICELNPFTTTTTETIFDIGTISNLPTGQSRFEVQGYKGTGNLRIHYFSMYNG